MQLSLDNEIQRRITDRVNSGQYGSPEEVIAAALAALEHEERAMEFAPGELDRLVAEGDASGPALDGDTVLAELKAKHRARIKLH
ncbi:MAG TPA: type II toxin-antitoxin system ParD family antitoxin [Phycisphaerae bacterium]|nr:type II toxin-antitoxin system ParD family antitoxin [Phycisphaerae bacterium]